MEQTKLTLGAVSKATGVSKPTLSRWRKSGVFTGEKQDNGSYLIDASELDRINARKEKGNGGNGNDNPKMKLSETPSEIRVLQLEIQMLRDRLGDKDSIISELRAANKEEREEKQRLLGVVETQTRLLPAPGKKPEELEEKADNQPETVLALPPPEPALPAPSPAQTEEAKNAWQWFKSCPLWSRDKKQKAAS